MLLPMPVDITDVNEKHVAAVAEVLDLTNEVRGERGVMALAPVGVARVPAAAARRSSSTWPRGHGERLEGEQS